MLYQGSKFTSPVANNFFPNFAPYRGDCTLIVNDMLRFFLAYKLQDKLLDLQETDKEFAFSEIFFDEQYVREVIEEASAYKESLIIIKDDSFDKDRNNVLPTSGSGFVALGTHNCSDNKTVNIVEKFLKSQTKIATKIFINEQIHSVVAFVDNQPNENWYICLFSAMSKIWTWLFDENSPDVLAIMQALGKKDFVTLVKILNTYFPDDLGIKINNKKLKEYGKCLAKGEIRALNQKIENIDYDLKSLYDRIDSFLLSRGDIYLQIEAFQALLQAKDDNELLDIFNNRKNIEIINVDNNNHYIQYVIKDTLEYYDEDELKRMLENKNSVFYNFSQKWIIPFVKAIFIENRGKICVQSEFTLSRLSTLYPNNYGDFETDYSEYMPQPHLGFYTCLGGNKNEIARYLQKNDWQMAIDQTIAATKNINFGDYSVMSRFISYLIENMNIGKFILADNGEKMTVKEFLEFIDFKEDESHE